MHNVLQQGKSFIKSYNRHIQSKGDIGEIPLPSRGHTLKHCSASGCASLFYCALKIIFQCSCKGICTRHTW